MSLGLKRLSRVLDPNCVNDHGIVGACMGYKARRVRAPNTKAVFTVSDERCPSPWKFPHNELVSAEDHSGFGRNSNFLLRYRSEPVRFVDFRALSSARDDKFGFISATEFHQSRPLHRKYCNKAMAMPPVRRCDHRFLCKRQSMIGGGDGDLAKLIADRTTKDTIVHLMRCLGAQAVFTAPPPPRIELDIENYNASSRDE